MACAQFIADLDLGTWNSCEQKLGPAAEKIQGSGCYAHVKMHSDKFIGKLKHGGHRPNVEEDLRKLQSCSIQPSGVATLTRLMLLKWNDMGECDYADAMSSYFVRGHGAGVRAVTNIQHQAGDPSDANGTEGRHMHCHRVLFTRSAGAQHLQKVADMISDESSQQVELRDEIHKDLWNRDFFDQMRAFMSLQFCTGPAGSRPNVCLNPVDCAIKIPGFKLDVFDESLRAVTGSTRLWDIKTDLRKEGRDVVLVPTQRLLSQVLMEHGTVRGANLHQPHAIKAFLTQNCSDGSASWVEKFCQVIQNAEKASVDYGLNFDTLAEWSTSWAILVPVTDPAQQAYYVQRFRRGIAAKSSGAWNNGAVMHEDMIRSEGLMRCSQPPVAALRRI